VTDIDFAGQVALPTEWPALPYDAWSATCDTLHAHTQVLGKLAAALAPPEPQLQHACRRPWLKRLLTFVVASSSPS
jgi:hypothetical protein